MTEGEPVFLFRDQTVIATAVEAECIQSVSALVLVHVHAHAHFDSYYTYVGLEDEDMNEDAPRVLGYAREDLKKYISQSRQGPFHAGGEQKVVGEKGHERGDEHENDYGVHEEVVERGGEEHTMRGAKVESVVEDNV